MKRKIAFIEYMGGSWDIDSGSLYVMNEYTIGGVLKRHWQDISSWTMRELANFFNLY